MKALRILEEESQKTNPDVKKLKLAKDKIVKYLNTEKYAIKQNLLYALTLLTKHDPGNGIEYMLEAKQFCGDDPTVYNNLGYLYSHRLNEYNTAVEYYKKCLSMDPTFILAIKGLCYIYQTLHLFADQVKILEDSLKLLPNNSDLLGALGLAKIHHYMNVYDPSCFDLDEILTILEKSIEKSSISKDEYTVNIGDVYLNMAFVYNIKGRIDLGIEYLLKSIQTTPVQNPLPYQNILLNLHYFNHDDPVYELVKKTLYPNAVNDIALRKQLVMQMFSHITPLPANRLQQNHTKNKFKLGIVSSDWNTHAVGRLSHGWLTNSKMETFVYSDVFYTDAIIRNEIPCDHYCYTKNMTTTELGNFIMTHDLDFLVDLSGFTANNRTDVFYYLQNVQKPILLTTYGYPNHTFIPNVKRIVDGFTHQISPTTDIAIDPSHFFFTYTPPRYAEHIEPKKHEPKTNNEVIFGCFARLVKINDRVVALWSRLLNEVPNSKLVVKSRIFCSKSEQEKWKARFGHLANRIICLKHTRNTEDHFKLFRMIDIHLDTFPYSGTLITLEALFMNIPVVAMYNSEAPHVSNVSAGILKHCDLQYCDNEEDYISEAKTLIDKRLYLNVREKFLNSSLFDYTGYSKMLDEKLIDYYHDVSNFEFVN